MIQILTGHFTCVLSQLAKDKSLPLTAVRYFVLDECDKMLEKLGRSEFLSLNVGHSACFAT